VPTKTFTPAEDRAFFLEIAALPILRIVSALLFLQLRHLLNREQIIATLKGIGT